MTCRGGCLSPCNESAPPATLAPDPRPSATKTQPRTRILTATFRRPHFFATDRQVTNLRPGSAVPTLGAAQAASSSSVLGASAGGAAALPLGPRGLGGGGRGRVPRR